VADAAERLRLDRVDQSAHPRLESARARHAFGRPFPALGGVLGRAALGRVDDVAGEQGLAPGRKARGVGEAQEDVERGAAQMGLGEVEADAGFLDDQPVEAVGLAFEQRGKARFLQRLERRPCLVDPIVRSHARVS
jgi:hypothetical protein